MSEVGFRGLLTARQLEIDSLVCVGLDPLVEKLPEHIRAGTTSTWSAMMHWMIGIVDATAKHASMFKPQRAHWESFPGGLKAMRAVIDHIHLVYPTIPVFLDCKRGDIGRTQRQYREAHFSLDGVDGMNYNGYMGLDTLKSLFDSEHSGRALVGLGRTSNPEAWVIQDALLQDGRRVWEMMVELLRDWSRELGVIENAGVVMGAAHKDPEDPDKIYSWHLFRAREIVKELLWFLIPGIGTQGGFVEETIAAAYTGPGSIAINSSSKIIFASSGRDFAEAAGYEAEVLREQIRSVGGSCAGFVVPGMGSQS